MIKVNGIFLSLTSVERTYFWLRICTLPLSFVHASTWFFPPSRKTTLESLRSVRPIVVFGKVGVTLKVPGTTWYASVSARS